MLAAGTAPAAAQWRSWDDSYPGPRRHVISHKPAEPKAPPISKEPFGDIPKGPLQIIVSIDQQKLHVYSDGAHIADTSVATGVPALPTPLGVFSVIQKQVFHRSNLYSDAPMPFMQRITWSGVALHEGENIGHRASHGCIRMPRDFALKLYGLTKMGARVIVADPELKPAEIADAHLFVHKDQPPAPPPVPAAPAPQVQAPAAPVADLAKTSQEPKISEAPKTSETLKTSEASKTAANDDNSKMVDTPPASAIPPAAMPLAATPPALTETASAQPIALGLRVSSDAPAPMAPAVTAPAMATPDNAAAAAKPSDAIDITKALAKKMPIAVFISRKEKKIYVRQDFTPLFSVPITIVQQDKPFGTHVFTAMNYLDDHASMRWTVVSMPGELPKQRYAENDRRPGKRGYQEVREERGKPPAVIPPPQTPQEALARIEIPQNALDAISQLFGPGSSLIVSDQGLGDETGEGTDFIVVMR
ncbi:MAG TPA: L,D-transpeptidase [Xanthobacteraceae bacterium]|jgi:hypothetical protein|nr:L,D-transpeptidase [Xanthobacteraceae bacterium]